MTEGAKGGFLAGMLVGVAAGMLLAPRRSRKAATENDSGACAELPSYAEAPVGRDDDAAAVLRRKIDETRRRLREQVGADIEP